MKKRVLGAGRYFFGDVTRVADPVVFVKCRASLFYTDGGDEIEVASGGSGLYDVAVIGRLGVCEFEKIGAADEFDECLEFCPGGLVFEVADRAVVFAADDYFEVSDVFTVSFARDCGLKFTSTDAEFELAENS